MTGESGLGLIDNSLTVNFYIHTSAQLIHSWVTTVTHE